MYHRFVHSFGTLNYGTESSSCFQAMRMANILTGGSLTRADIANAELFLAWAYNPFYNGVYHDDALELLRKKGLKVIAIDPRTTQFSQRADLHLKIRAGTDGALALCFGNYLIEHDAIDHDYIRQHVHGYPEYRDYVRSFTPEYTAELTELKAEDIIRAAELLVQNRRFAISLGAAPLTITAMACRISVRCCHCPPSAGAMIVPAETCPQSFLIHGEMPTATLGTRPSFRRCVRQTQNRRSVRSGFRSGQNSSTNFRPWISHARF